MGLNDFTHLGVTFSMHKGTVVILFQVVDQIPPPLVLNIHFLGHTVHDDKTFAHEAKQIVILLSLLSYCHQLPAG